MLNTKAPEKRKYVRKNQAPTGAQGADGTAPAKLSYEELEIQLEVANRERHSLAQQLQMTSALYISDTNRLKTYIKNMGNRLTVAALDCKIHLGEDADDGNQLRQPADKKSL